MNSGTSALIRLPGNTVVWKYLTNRKLSSLLTGQSYFRRSDKFKDSFDSALPQFMIDAFIEADKKYMAGSGLDIEEFPANLEEQIRATYYVGCWNANLDECERMWNEYAPGDDSVAILSTVADLESTFDRGGGHIDVFKVNYVDRTVANQDYWLSSDDMCRAAFTKSAEFSWENEVRIVAYRFPANPEISTGSWTASANNPDGRLIDCHLERLVRKAIVKQTCGPAARATLERNLKAAGLNVPIEVSKVV